MGTTDDRIALLETEVNKLKDCEAIRQLLARYGPMVDSADTATRRRAAGELFAADGVYDLADDWQGTGPTGIGELLNNPDHLDLIAHGSAHVMGLPYIVLDGDQATALSYSRVYRHRDGVFSVWRVSINYWQCARVAGQWQVQRRSNRLLDGSAAARALLEKVDIQ
jgi:hypothetical protein